MICMAHGNTHLYGSWDVSSSAGRLQWLYFDRSEPQPDLHPLLQTQKVGCFAFLNRTHSHPLMRGGREEMKRREMERGREEGDGGRQRGGRWREAESREMEGGREEGDGGRQRGVKGKV